jgi:hypothetical protein
MPEIYGNSAFKCWDYSYKPLQLPCLDFQTISNVQTLQIRANGSELLVESHIRMRDVELLGKSNSSAVSQSEVTLGILERRNGC